MEHWYVYYKLPAHEAQPCAAALRPRLAALAAATGVAARLLRREDDPGDTATLMEVYGPIVDSRHFATALEAALRQWPREALTERRTEQFMEC